jgi:beta-RFAP synthase
MSDYKHGEITVTTGSRLHFGLMQTGPPFGGLGVMIDQPQNVVAIKPSDHWQCDCGFADRILPIAQRLMQYCGTDELPRCNVQIQQGLISHCGLGSGTQLSLAIAEGLCRFLGTEVPPLEIATAIANRGKRSAVGVHGFFNGGLIFESPASRIQSPDQKVPDQKFSDQKFSDQKFSEQRFSEQKLNPVTQRIELPQSWRIAFLMPLNNDQAAKNQSISGDDEAECFSQLGNEESRQIRQLSRTITDRILPAANASDFKAFCRAVADYNQQSGMLFADVQGGPYNGTEVTTLIQTLQNLGLEGIGQSSWGPGVFAWFDSQKSLNEFKIESQPHRYRIIATARVKNSGRDVVDRG